MLFALLGALLVGLSLGSLGSGGSILTVPVLTYLVGQPEKVAIAGSLVIVGGIALVGAITAWRAGKVDLRSVLWFGIPGMVGSFGGAWLGGLVSGTVQLVVFGALMMVGAWLMLKPMDTSRSAPVSPPRALIVVEGFLVGIITGFVGVGGGFLIVPALGILGGLSMSRAIGTSLVIIVMKSLAGFAKYQGVLAAQGLELDWTVIGLFVAVGIAGSLLGQKFGQGLSEVRLRQCFAALLIVVGSGILAQGAWRLSAADSQAATSDSAALSQVQTGNSSGA